MIWNYHDHDLRGTQELVQVNVQCVPAKQVTIHEYRIDSAHSNSYEVWKKMGSPQQPTTQQIAQLEKAGKLQKTKTEKMPVKNGSLGISLNLPRQGVAFYKIEW